MESGSHPRTVRLNPSSETDSVAEAVAVLKRGGLVVFPTDTVYGVAADQRVAGAVQRLCRAKGRDAAKPIPLLAACIEDVERFGVVAGPVERKLAAAFWPGPLTLVLKAGAGTEGFRVPDCDVALALLRQTGVLRVTSANLSGEPPALTAGEAVAALGDSVDLVLDGGLVRGGVPSSVVKVVDGRIEMLREGAITMSQMEKVCQQENR